MSEKQIVAVEYEIMFFSDREKNVTITVEQYEKIQPLLNDYKFIEVNKVSYNVSDIRCIERIEHERAYYMKVGEECFYSEEEWKKSEFYLPWLNH